MGDASKGHRSGLSLESVRAEFARLAAHRVDAADVEDVVQDAMRVVIEKGYHIQTEREGDPPALARCFQVLRYTIGNHYRREKMRRRWIVREELPNQEGSVSAGRLVESMGSIETWTVVQTALESIRRDHPQCGQYLMRLVEGLRPREVAEEEGLDPAVFYRRLYRCRGKLRQLLVAKGIMI